MRHKPYFTIAQEGYDEKTTGVDMSPEMLEEYVEENEFDHVARVSEDLKESASEHQTMDAAYEALEEYANTIQHLIADNACTESTLDLIHYGIQQQVNILGLEGIPARALEEAGDVVTAHQIALEGIRDILNRIAQQYVLSFKHFWNALTDSVKLLSQRVAKYQEKYVKTKAEFEEKKKTWKEKQHVGSLNELWYHFSTDAGQVTNISQQLKKEKEITKYILDDFTIDTISSMEKFLTILKQSNVRSPKDVVAVVKKLEDISAPALTFKQQYLKGRPYLDVTGFTLYQGTKRLTLAFGDAGFAKLAQLASRSVIYTDGSFGHAVKKAATKVIVNNLPGASFLGKTITMSTEEIGALIEDMKWFLDQVEKSRKVINTAREKFESLFTPIEVDLSGYDPVSGHYYDASATLHEEHQKMIKSFLNIQVDALDKEQQRDLVPIVRQISQAMQNIFQSLIHPTVDEMYRGVKTAKYCNYLALRMIYNAR